MLNAMRENFRHLKWLLWIVAASMVLYLGYYFGGSSRGRGADADWAARVDGSEISAREFLESARRADEYYRKLFGAQYEQLRSQLQLGRQVIQSLVDRQIELGEARKLGLEASAAEVSRQILSDPQFKDGSGRFVGKDRYAAIMNRAYPGGVGAYEGYLADEIAITKWRDLVTEPVEVSDGELLDLYRSRSEKAVVDYVVVPSGQQPPAAVSEADLAAWYEGHKDAYRRGEGRKIRYVVVERQAQVPKVKIGDDEVRAFYDSNRNRYERPEQRRARHILFRVEQGATPEAKEAARKQAEGVLERIRKGEDFAALARTLSQDPGSAKNGGDLGFFGKGSMVPPFEKAAFETPVGQLAPVVESDFGFHVLQVTDSRPAGVVPFEEVRDGIRRQLELQKAQEAVQSEAQRLRASIQTAKDLDAVASRESLKVKEAVITREDVPPELGASPDFVDAVLQLAPGSISQPLGVAAGMAIATAVETVPPSIAPLQVVRDRIRTEILNTRARDAALATARRALTTHPDLAAAAKAVGGEVKSGAELQPGRSLPGAGRSPDLEKAVFGPSAKPGDRGAVAAPAGAILYSIVKRETFDPTRFENSKAGLRKEVLGQRRAAVLQAMLDGIRQQHRVEINEEMVDRVRG